ncbi:hypothetical protein GV827_05460 [Sulfitobacter sp. JBTF-M27]|uniref:Uncharacterized protein n=1 Tax=Sulfitobacter sediminilitoris TaxID=2698830 RepID=A0A6P0C6Q6_9RHOB|nr:hypothetical protein [Sulfitobacter sediminilitoris]NEK21849.1 hypothetical protein [Sulfitobacter sediminilitoris]
MKPSRAINQAKAAFELPLGEPKVGSDAVNLRHLWHALELVSSMGDNAAIQTLHQALKSGQLVAHAHSNGAKIPSRTWLKAPSAQSNGSPPGWLTGVIYFHHDLENFKGELPVVALKEAESWLSTFSPKAGPGRPSKRAVAAKAYKKLYPNGHTAANATWKQVALSVEEVLGSQVSIRTIQRGLGLAS